MPTYDGTCRVQQIGKRIRFEWTSDVAGSVTHRMEFPIRGTLDKIITKPIDTPTDNYDITLTDVFGVDVLDSRAINRDTTNAEMQTGYIQSSSGTTTVSNTQYQIEPIRLDGIYTFGITTAGSAKSGIVEFVMR